MKVISLSQPWASLIRDGRKNIETRSWKTNYVGRIGIHASNTIIVDACIYFGYDSNTIERGVILCTAELVGCVRFPHPKIKPDEYGDFSDGRYGWVLKNIEALTNPIPVKGKLGLWTFEDLPDGRKNQNRRL